MRILLSAFACDPFFGSDEEVGWRWAKELSDRGLNVTVITRSSHKKNIDSHIQKTGECTSVKFEYVDINWIHSSLRHVNPRNHIYYYIWQWAAYQRAMRLHVEKPFDLVHHVTWVSFRQPSFMGLMGIPMFFGPVAGGDEIPSGYTKNFSKNQQLTELLRKVVNSMVRFDPLMYLTFKKAKKVFFTSESHLKLVPDFVKNKACIELAVGCNSQTELELIDHNKKLQGNRLLFVGRCIGLKGMDLGLQIFAKIRQVRPDVTLTIIGDGVDRVRWMDAAKSLGVANAINWLGWLPKADVLKLYSDFDVLFYPSLRDSGGFVVLEALQCGLPVVCFKLGGPGVVVDDTCGGSVVATDDIKETVSVYVETVITTLDRVINEGSTFSESCKTRAGKFTWDALVNSIYGFEIERDV